MGEIKDWSELKVGDFLHMVEEYGDQLYEITAVGGQGSNFHLKAKCFFGKDKGRDVTLYKLNKNKETK